VTVSKVTGQLLFLIHCDRALPEKPANPTTTAGGCAAATTLPSAAAKKRFRRALR